MTDRIRKAAYFSMRVPNTPGQCAKLLVRLRENGINLLAFTGFPNGRTAQVDFIPENPAAFVRAARRMGIKSGKRKTVFLVQGNDRVGALVSIAEKFAKARINMTAIDAVCAGKGRYAAIFWVKPKRVAKAARLIGAR